MSGIEIVGLVLGAFPLIISAMEHYEDVKAPTRIWWKIRAVHSRDLSSVKDSQFAFTHQLERLLYPLLDSEVVDQAEYEQLLVQAGGEGWEKESLQNALVDRLGKRHSIFIATLNEMAEAIDKLCRATRVDDPQFQALLAQRHGPQSAACTQQPRARTTLMLRANAKFEAKRIKYSFTEKERKALLQEVEAYITRLDRLLSHSDESTTLFSKSRDSSRRWISTKVSQFYQRAETIYRLLGDMWLCHCRSHACLWLEQNYAKVTEMRMHLAFCHGGRSIAVKVTEKPPTIQISSRHRKRPGQPDGSNKARSGPKSVTMCTSGVTSLASSTEKLHGSSTITISQAAVKGPVPSLSTSSGRPSNATNDLCMALGSAQTGNPCVCTVAEDEHEYTVVQLTETISPASYRTLADELQSNDGLGRVQRYSIALTLASSHLQLHQTSWLGQTWRCEDVRLPISQQDRGIRFGEPYVQADLSPSQASAQSLKDRSFATLGIVLLELCFGERLEGHSLWSDPAYSGHELEPLYRQAVASEWLDEKVENETGPDYAQAIAWLLHQAPSTMKDDKWRVDFAENVVRPLQRCFDSIKPR